MCITAILIILEPMRRKRVLAAFLVCMAAAAMAAAVFFTRPGYAIVLPEHPSWYSLGEPLFSLSFRKTGDCRNADVLFVMPGMSVPETSGSVILMRPAESGEDYPVLDIDEAELWAAALGDGRECIVYESSDGAASAVAAALSARDGNAFSVTYDGRITDANLERTLRQMEGADKVLLLTPATSVMLARNGRLSVPAVMDFRDAGALTAASCSEVVTIDWGHLIRSALAGEAGLSYALAAR